MRHASLRLAIPCALMAVTMGFANDPHQEPAPAPPVPSIVEARHKAELLHTTMHATLQIVHHRYYREDEGLLLPAATLREVFSEIEREHNIQLRWLAVEGQVMNADHAPRDDFEKAAAKALEAGQDFHEQVLDGQLRRAAPITLSNHCLKCHVPDRKNTDDRTAGLIISMAVSSP